MSEKWCEHITYQPIKKMGAGFIWWHSLNKSTNGTYCASEWLFCPDCGTPRPTAPKKLSEKLNDVFDNTYRTLAWDAVAKCAVEEFQKILDDKCRGYKTLRGEITNALVELLYPLAEREKIV